MSRAYTNSNADYLATVGGVKATASWVLNATSISVAAGLTFIVNGATVYDATLGLSVGTVTGYSGTTLSITAASHASSGMTDNLIVVASLQTLLTSGVTTTVSAWFKPTSNPTNNEVLFAMGSIGSASKSANRLYLSWNSPQLILGMEPANNQNATYSAKATSTWAISAATIPVQAGLTFFPGQTIYDITVSALVGTVSSYNAGTGVITLTGGGATHASSAGSTDSLLIGTQLTAGSTWHHGGGVVTSTGATCYLDGSLTGTSVSSNTFPPDINMASIGAQQNSSIQFPFTGSIGEVAVWSSALTGAQMAALAGGVPACFISPATLIGYWPITGQNSPEPDFSTLANNMAVTGTLAQDVAPPAVTTPKVVFYPTTGNITLPSDFNTAFNLIEAIGESGAAAGGTTLATGGGAGAGAYAGIVNYSANGPSASVAITVGTGGTSTKTIFDTGNNSCVADFGTSASGATAGAGGLVANSTGMTKYAGGNGGAGATSAGGSGGGSAGPGGSGPNGTGGNAAASSTTTSGNGGSTNNGAQAGGVGVGTTNPGNPGIAQSPALWTQTVGGATASPSSGASGAGGLTTTAESGGAAVAYGGAPGGGDIVATGTSSPGATSAGIIVLTYLSNLKIAAYAIGRNVLQSHGQAT